MKKLICMISTVLICCVLSGCGNNETGEDLGKIKDISVDDHNIVALSENNELYAIGENISNEIGIGESKHTDSITKVASDVKEFKFSNGIYYLDFNDNLYHAGMRIDGSGIANDFEKVNEKINKFDQFATFALITWDKDNNISIQNGNFSRNYGGFNGLLDKSTVVTNDKVKYLFTSCFLTGYINENNELYMINKATNNKFIKVLDNVETVSSESINNLVYILTKDKVLYTINTLNAQNVIVPTPDDYKLVKLDENVDSLISYGYKKDGKTYVELKNNLSFNETEKDIKDIYYADKNKLIYLNSEDKVVMGETVIENNISNIDDILNYVENE